MLIYIYTLKERLEQQDIRYFSNKRGDIIRYIRNKRVDIHIGRSNCNERIAIAMKELLYWIRRQTLIILGSTRECTEGRNHFNVASVTGH